MRVSLGGQLWRLTIFRQAVLLCIWINISIWNYWIWVINNIPSYSLTIWDESYFWNPTATYNTYNIYRISRYPTENKILSNNQFGFREKHFTSRVLISLINKTAIVIDNTNFFPGVFLDLSKVFDTIDHSIL